MNEFTAKMMAQLLGGKAVKVDETVDVAEWMVVITATGPHGAKVEFLINDLGWTLLQDGRLVEASI
jgi:hypothetical protein